MDNVRPSAYYLSLMLAINKAPSYTDTIMLNIAIESATDIVLEANLTLPMRCLWDVVVLAYGCHSETSVLTNELEISIKINITS